MNKTKYLGISLALAATLASCSTNDFDTAPAINGNGMITAYTPQSGESTRTAYEADDSNLKVTWSASDENMYTINAATDGWTAGQLKQVSVAENGTSANFNAYDIDGTKQVGYKAGKLFAFYPQNTAVASSFQNITSDGTTATVPLSLTGQSGKLTDLHNYDYMTATSIVSADNNVDALQMKHEIAVLHINKGIKTLVENGTISKVVVSATGLKTAGTMTITRNGSDITTAVAGTGSDASLTINNCSYKVENNQLADDIYLAILPGTMSNLTMKLTIDGNDFDYVYQGNVSDFQAGKVYNWSPTVDPGVMYFTIKTTSSKKDFTIPFATSGTCPAQIVVNWGDGSSTTVNKGASLGTTTFKHTYASNNKSYRITVNSAEKDVTKQQVPEFNFGKYPTNTSEKSNRNENGELLYSVDSPVLYSGVTSLASMFYGAENLTSVSEATFALYPDVTSMNNVFGAYKSGKLASIPANLFVNNTKVTSFSWAFGYQTNLTTIPAALFDKNTQVTTFASTFRSCTSLSSIPSGLFDKNTAVTTFQSTFRYCTSLSSIPSGLFDKNTAVTTFNAVFRDCTSLVSVPAHLFDANKEVTDFESTFDTCTKLASLPEGLFAKNTKATTFKYIFYDCSALKYNANIFIDEEFPKNKRFANTDAYINFENMFWVDNPTTTAGGTLPDLWNYTYKKGYGWTVSGSSSSGYKAPINMYYRNIYSNANISAFWYSSTASRDSNFKAL